MKLADLQRQGVLRPDPLGARRVRLLGVRGRHHPRPAAVLELPEGGRRRHHRRHALPLALRARQPLRPGEGGLVPGRDPHPRALGRARASPTGPRPTTRPTPPSSWRAASSRTSTPRGRCGCGATTSSRCRWTARWAPRWPACATAGSSPTAPPRARSGTPTSPTPIDFSSTWQKMPEQRTYDNAFKAQWELFLRARRAGRAVPLDLLEARRACSSPRRALESWRKRRWVDVPPTLRRGPRGAARPRPGAGAWPSSRGAPGHRPRLRRGARPRGLRPRGGRRAPGGEAEAAAALEELRVGGAAVLYVQADIGDDEAAERIVAAVRGRFGRLDVLVNNAGVAPQERRDILEATRESFDRLMRINLRGPYFLTQAAARLMLEQKAAGARRSTAASSSSPRSRPRSRRSNRGEYCISKAGLSMAGRSGPRGLPSAGSPSTRCAPGSSART